MDDKKRKYINEWKKKNHGSVAKYQRSYRENNYDTVRKIERKYYLANRERIIEKAQERNKLKRNKPKPEPKEPINFKSVFACLDSVLNHDILA